MPISVMGESTFSSCPSVSSSSSVEGSSLSKSSEACCAACASAPPSTKRLASVRRSEASTPPSTRDLLVRSHASATVRSLVAPRRSRSLETTSCVLSPSSVTIPFQAAMRPAFSMMPRSLTRVAPQAARRASPAGAPSSSASR